MARLLLLVMLLTACAAIPQDLSGQTFTFPEKTNTTHVKLKTYGPSLSAVTVCLRFFTDLSRTHSLFSLATPNATNAFQIRKDHATGVMNVFVDNNVVRFRGLRLVLNVWHSVCCTWDEYSGLVQLWLDGQPTVRKFIGGSVIEHPIIILGQDQDSPGGDFDSEQSFVGMLSDVHMWDYALSPCEIQNYLDDLNFTPGSMLNWRALKFRPFGRVLVEDKFLSCK